MPEIATARWPGMCSKCKGKIAYGDTIVTYSREKRESSKKAHHHYPGCAPFTGEVVYVDVESTDLSDLKHRLRTLKQINTGWAIDEIVKITKMDISSSWDEKPIEFDAFMHILLDREEQIGTGGILTIINQIFIEAKRADIKIEASNILSDWSRL